LNFNRFSLKVKKYNIIPFTYTFAYKSNPNLGKLNKLLSVIKKAFNHKYLFIIEINKRNDKQKYHLNPFCSAITRSFY